MEGAVWNAIWPRKKALKKKKFRKQMKSTVRIEEECRRFKQIIKIHGDNLLYSSSER